MVTKLRERLISEAGFTLIELMLVVAVLGILAGIAVPRITGVQDEALKGMLESNGTTIRNAMERDKALNGDYPDLSKVNNLSELSDELKSTDLAVNTDKVTLTSAELDATYEEETYDYVIKIEDSDGNYTAVILPNNVIIK